MTGERSEPSIDLPSPDVAAQWEKLSPGSVSLFLSIVESQTILRAKADDERVRQEQNLAKTSLWMAFLLALLLIGAAIAFFASGNSLAGGLLLGVPATGVAISFVPKALVAGRGSGES